MSGRNLSSAGVKGVGGPAGGGRVGRYEETPVSSPFTVRMEVTGTGGRDTPDWRGYRRLRWVLGLTAGSVER